MSERIYAVAKKGGYHAICTHMTLEEAQEFVKGRETAVEIQKMIIESEKKRK